MTNTTRGRTDEYGKGKDDAVKEKMKKKKMTR